MPRSLVILTLSALFMFSLVPVSLPAQPSNAGPPPAAQDARALAEKAAATERSLYIVSMNLIEREWQLNNVSHVLELLQETKENPYRGFEWGYWNRLCHLDRMTLSGHTGGISAVAYSRDGKRLLTASWGDKTAQVLDAETGKVLITLRHAQGFASAAFSPDGKRIVTCNNYDVIVWDAETGKEVFTITAHMGAIRAVYSPDGARIATAGLDGWAKLFDARSG
ncbi:MAG TPA: hypothetical protein VKU00_05440 [Chthonomonadaceae bacterium]|nr:hypothetical protein [Chthonomonadaceae bacterium]